MSVAGRLVLLPALASSLAFAAPARAQEQGWDQGQGWILTLKGNAVLGPRWAGSSDLSAIGYPSFSIRREGSADRFSAPDDGADWGFIDTGWLRAGLVGRITPGRYYSDDRRKLFGLDDVKWGAEAGVFAEFWPVQDRFRARFEVRHGIRGHDGFVAKAGLDYVQKIDALTLAVGPRIHLGDSDYMRANFGVSAAESILNGQVLPYSPGGGLKSVGVAASANYKWNERLSTGVHATYERLMGPAADSPIVETLGSRNQMTFGLTAAYSFGLKGY